MSGGFCSPTTCGFAKVAAIYSAKKAKGLDYNPAKSPIESRYEYFCEIFMENQKDFNIDYKTFNKRFLALEALVRKWNPKKKEEKMKFFTEFSCERWLSLSQARKNEHSFTNCKGCYQNYAATQALFPVKSLALKSKAKENPFRVAAEINSNLGKGGNTKPGKKQAITVARELFKELNPVFNKWAGISLGEAMSKVPEANVEVKKTAAERKSLRRKFLRNIKEDVEKKWQETSLQRCLGNRQSFASLQRERLSSTLETKQCAKRRRELALEKEGRKKKKNHSGKIENMIEGDKKDDLLKEVNDYPEGHIINWSELARKYNVTDKSGNLARNGGQMMQDFLSKQGIDVNKFKKPIVQQRVRRQKLRGKGGEISVPTSETNDSLKKTIKAKIVNGEILVGEMIVPKKYSKLVLNKNNEIEVTEFTVHGRKIPLDEIRKLTLEKLREYTRVYPNSHYDDMTRLEVAKRLEELNELDESDGLTTMREKLKTLERTRHLMIWHDHSTVANHGHLLFLVSVLYDPALHLTSTEYKAKTGKVIDIQEEVERPQIYIFARCNDTDVEQLAYSETRCECLKELSSEIEIEEGVKIHDKMRFCKGDGPAVEYECGQQRGGNYFCAGCGIHCCMIDDLEHAFRCQSFTLEERQKVILDGPITKRNTLQLKPDPCDNLKKNELQQEARKRKLECDFNLKDPLQKAFEEHLHGQKRVPAIFYQSPTETVENLNLSKYEVLPCEPMHDLAGHIKNLLEELPRHLGQEESKLITETINLAAEGKDKKRACDQRYSLIAVSSRIRGKVSMKVQQLVDTLVEMQDILYGSEDERCPRVILRYCNQSFLHAILCFEVIGFQPKTMTCRKLYGKYFHNLTRHAGFQLRLVSGKAMNAEDEERLFNAINSITKSTSSKHPSHVIGNVLIRLQAEEELREINEGSRRQEHPNKIRELSKTLPTFLDSIFPPYILEKYPKYWQAHLEAISDYLCTSKEQRWWEFDGANVIFLDSKERPKTRQDGPLLHHFRSSNIKQEEAYLSQCWSQSLQDGTCLPAHYLFTPASKDRLKKTTTGFLRSEELDAETIESDVPMVPFDDVIDDNDNEAIPSNDEQEDFDIIEVTDVQTGEMGNQELYEDNTVTDTVVEVFETDVVELPNETDESPPTDNPQSSDQYASPNQTHPALEEDEFSTRLATAVSNVLSATDDVKTLDSLKSKLKTCNDSHNYEQYMNCLAAIQTKVLRKKSILENDLKKWEQDFFVNKNFCTPSLSDINGDSTASVILKGIKNAKALVKHWNIRF